MDLVTNEMEFVIGYLRSGICTRGPRFPVLVYISPLLFSLYTTSSSSFFTVAAYYFFVRPFALSLSLSAHFFFATCACRCNNAIIMVAGMRSLARIFIIGPAYCLPRELSSLAHFFKLAESCCCPTASGPSLSLPTCPRVPYAGDIVLHILISRHCFSYSSSSSSLLCCFSFSFFCVVCFRVLVSFYASQFFCCAYVANTERKSILSI